VRLWLISEHFGGDLRSARAGWPFLPPLGVACWRGELNVCKWLYGHGAAPDITRVNEYGATPMIMACEQGHMSVCKWLFGVGGVEVVKKAKNDGSSPLWWACKTGNLPMCEWLFEVGATKDITKANTNSGATPMYVACEGGHLSVCKWLYEVGAAEDITKANNTGRTPMGIACLHGRLSVCKWLVFNGALNTPPPAQHDDGHVDQAIVERVTSDPSSSVSRLTLLAWAQQVVAIHHTFSLVVLHTSVNLPESHHQVSPDQRCYLPRLRRSDMVRIGMFLDVEMGRRLRNAREFAEALKVIV
jgi:ankyrin repeat protein